MTVAELLRKLEGINPEAIVLIPDKPNEWAGHTLIQCTHVAATMEGPFDNNPDWLKSTKVILS